MPRKPELNISGYRGIWGESLNTQIARDFARAFALFTKEDTNKKNPTILIGRDGRESGPIIKEAVIEELLNFGANVVDGDIIPTPTALFSVRNNKYDGAIMITASHNPINYNGLKFVNKQALFTTKSEIEKINKYFNDKVAVEKSETLGKLEKNVNLPKEHVNHILKFINVEAIRNRKFKVAVDMINASACVIDPYLFEKLGVELISLNNTPDGNFAHKPEPTRENLVATGEMVKNTSADLGFAHDPDADRLVVINEKGEVISEEYTLAFCIENILSKNPNQTIAANLSTSAMNEEIAKNHGGECFYSKVGEGNVVDKMLEKNAIIGGEGNGGVIYPKINTGRDGFVGIALILELLAERNQTISEIVSLLPKFYMQKEKWEVDGKNLEIIYEKLKNHYKTAKIDEQDGLRLSFPNKSWIHLRPSNTEPIIRLFGEAKTELEIKALLAETKLTLGLK